MKKEEYGEKFAGTYSVRIINWKEGRELLRRALRTKDPTEYLEELVVATVRGPMEETMTRERLGELPSGLIRRLMDETVRLNDIGRQESAFLSS